MFAFSVEVHKENEHILNECILKMADDEATSLEQDINDAFTVFDRNNDGFLCVDDVRSLLANIGVKLRHDELEQFMATGGRNQDGLIDLNGTQCMVST